MQLADPEIRRAAKTMLDRDGAKALDRAARMASRLRVAGDTEAWWTWARICRVIVMLLLAEPGEPTEALDHQGADPAGGDGQQPGEGHGIAD